MVFFYSLLSGSGDQIHKIHSQRLADGLDVVEGEGHLVAESVGDVAR